MEKVGVVICNYNKRDDVLKCIQSIRESKFTDYRLYVVDNASADDSVKEIRAHYTELDLTLIVNSENLGGSGGFNTGLRMAVEKGHEYLMCVDNDAMLDENCMGELFDFLEKNPEAGIAAAKIYHTGMEDYVQQYGSTIDFENYIVNSTYLNHIEDGTMPEVVYSDAVPACALMIRASLVKRIGLMPEENFLYWDDTEWCYRCRAAGYKVASVGRAAACHAMGAKKEDVNTFPTYYAWRNWIVFFLQHIEEGQLEDMAEVFLGSIFEVQYEGLFRGEYNKANTVMAALDDALHGVMGKAGPDRIFDIDASYDGLNRMVAGHNSFYIEENGYPLYAESLRQKLLELRPEVSVTLSSQTAFSHMSANTAVISLCESIFRQDDLELKSYVVDLDGCVIQSEDDLMMVINYPYSRASFIFAQKPLFIRLAKALRY